MKGIMAIGAGFLSLTLAVTALASEYKIGDRMPDYKFKNEIVMHPFAWGDEPCRGTMVEYGKGLGGTEYIAFFTRNGFYSNEQAFAVFDSKTNQLLIDNKKRFGATGSDGRIDMILEGSHPDNSREGLMKHVTYCQEK